MPIEYFIHDMRLSFIWVEDIFNFVKNEIPPGANLSFLNNQLGYVNAFAKLQNMESQFHLAVTSNETKPTEVAQDQTWSNALTNRITERIKKTPFWKKIFPADMEKISADTSQDPIREEVINQLQQPWRPDSRKQKFWSYYLETLIPGQVNKNTVWEKLIPFFFDIESLDINSPSWLPGRIATQSFIYPHSIVFIITAEVKLPKDENLTLDEAISIAYQVRRTGRFQVASPYNSTAQMLSLDEVARTGLRSVRDFMMGTEAPSYEWSNRSPFSVATIVQGSGGTEFDTPNNQVVRFLDALARWPNYDWHNPPPRNTPNLNPEDQAEVYKGYPGDMLHISPRGRSVWYPKHFLKKSGRVNMLSCYHTNLNMLSMQIDSLGSLALNAANEISTGNPPPPSSFYETCVKRAAINLSLLYLGGGSEKKSYRSWSAKRQIEQNNYLDAINIVRDRLCNLLPIN